MVWGNCLPKGLHLSPPASQWSPLIYLGEEMFNSKKKIKEYNKRYYLLHRDYLIRESKEYFYKHRDERNKKKREYYYQHKEEKLTYQRKYQFEHREETKKYLQRYQREHKEKMKMNFANYRVHFKNAGKLTFQTIQQVYDENIIANSGVLRCIYCGRKLTMKEATLEHKQPISREGTNDKENLAIACHSCNCSKRDKTEKEFREWLVKMEGENARRRIVYLNAREGK